FDVLSLPSTVSLTIDGDDPANATGGNDVVTIGNETANFADGTGDLSPIDGPITVNGRAGSGDQLNVDDTGDSTGRTYRLTGSAFTTDPTPDAGGFFANGITSYATFEQMRISLGSGGDVLNVRGTSALPYNVDTLGGNDVVNVSSAAPPNTGSLSTILGSIRLNTGSGTDSLNVSDLTNGVARTYGISKSAGVTSVSFTGGPATLQYDFNGTQQLENFTLSGSRAGGTNVYNVGVTSALSSNVINDGDATGSGASQFEAQANAVQGGASNTFNGFAGNDAFNLNFAAGTSIPTTAGTTLQVNG